MSSQVKFEVFPWHLEVVPAKSCRVGQVCQDRSIPVKLFSPARPNYDFWAINHPFKLFSSITSAELLSQFRGFLLPTSDFY